MNVRITALSALVLLACLTSACGANHNRANVSPAPMPTGGTFTGVWFSPQYGEMNMIQTGEAVICEYTKDERRGRIEGTAQGNLMRFQWTERRELVSGVPQTNRGRGYFQLLHDGEGFKIVGAWGIDDNEVGGGPWNAIRSPRREPHISSGSDHSEGGSSEGNGSTYDTSSSPTTTTPPPANNGEDDLQGL